MELTLPSGAHYQLENLKTVLTALDILNARLPKITRESVQTGLAEFPSLTSFKGRWQILSDEGPLILSDAAHNAEGLKMLFNQVKELNYGNLYCIMGSVRGKNIDDFIKVLPGHARFIFVKPNVPRGLEADVLVKRALQRNLKAEASESVALALKEARSLARPEDLILIAGSIFILDEAEKAASI